MKVKSLLAVSLLAVSVTSAGALDVKDLEPCKAAAARYCERGDREASMVNLIRCGAALAVVAHRIGESCRVVLRRYGQL